MVKLLMITKNILKIQSNCSFIISYYNKSIYSDLFKSVENNISGKMATNI